MRVSGIVLSSLSLLLVAPACAWVSPVPTTTTATSRTLPTKTQLKVSFLQDLFSQEPAAAATPPPPKYDPVTIGPDFRVAGAFLAAGLLLDQIPYVQLTLGPIVTLLGLLFLVQSFRIRFVLNEDNALELVTVTNPLTGETESSGENVVVGGANVWACDTIVNYDFFPAIDSSPVGPILVYFKETQTPAENWNEGPGEAANDPAKIAAGVAVPGQVHFFPAVCNAEQLRDEFVKRQVSKL